MPACRTFAASTTYEGHKIHSARWDHDYDFEGKKIAVVGTGASAVQIVPELVKIADTVKVFQRTPGWTLPRMNPKVQAGTKRRYARYPQTQTLARSLWFWGHESVALGVVWKTPLTRIVELVGRAHLRRQVRDPWLRRQLTPRFRAGCKRLLMTSDYYPALQKPTLHVGDLADRDASPKGIRTVEGVEHQFDAIVFATGFDVSKTGTPIPITGRDSRVLADEWSAGAIGVQEYCGIRLPEPVLHFRPQLGPGTQLGTGVHGGADRLSRGDHRARGRSHSADVRQDVQDAYNDDMQRSWPRRPGIPVASWYLTEDGFNATMFPGFATQYVNQLKSVDLRDYTSTVREKDTAQT